MGLEINLFQIVQHPPEDLPVRDASEHPLVEFNRITVLLVNAIAAVVSSQNFAAVERIQEELLRAVGVLDDEVPGHPDSDNRKFQAPRHFHINRRESDWNSDAPVEHIVQKRVEGIVIIGGIAPEHLFGKQHLVHGGNAFHGIARFSDFLAGALPQFIDLAEINGRIQLWIFDAGKGQSGLCQVNALIVNLGPHQVRECPNDFRTALQLHIKIVTEFRVAVAFFVNIEIIAIPGLVLARGPNSAHLPCPCSLLLTQPK